MRLIKAGATSQIVYVSVLDSASTTGGRKTGIAYNAGSFVASYARNGAARVAITLATQTVAGAFSSGGWIEVDATNMPGIYRLDIPDAAIAAGVPSVVVTLKGAAGMVQVDLEIQLTAIDLQDVIRMAMTALPNAAAEAAGGLYTRGTGAGQVNQPANGMLDANLVRWLGTAAATPTIAGVPEVDLTHIGGDAQSGTDLKDFADAGYDPALNKVEGVKLADTLTTYTGNTLQTGDSFARIGAAGASLSGIPWNGAAWDAEVQSEVNDALVAYDPPTGAELVSEINAVQTDIAGLDTLIDAIKAVTDQLVAAHAEPTGVPAVNEVWLDKVGYLFASLINKVVVDQTAGELIFYDNAGVALWKKPLSDTGTALTEDEGVAP